MRPVLAAALWILGCFALIYVPDCGLGFIKDDYGWIASSQLSGWDAVWRLFISAPMGFYRPLVSISFGANALAFGLNPVPYGLTNLALAIAVAAAIWWLIVRLGFTLEMSFFAASVWLLNFHGIGLAILWKSGRTSLLATLFAVCAACAFTASRPLLCGIFTLLALLSKEEPLLLPAVFLLWLLIDRSAAANTPEATDRTRWWSVAFSSLAVAIYLAVRSSTGALTPWTAPDFYQYRLAAFPFNTLQYADRSLTLTVSLLILGALFVQRRDFSLTSLERSTILKGLVWLVCGFVLTIMIPSRSSLYVCLPAVGSSLILASVASAEWRAIRRRRLVVGCLLIMPLAFLPVYRARHLELRNEQVLSSNAVQVLASRLRERQVSHVIVYDDIGRHPSVGDAFGDALPVALRLVVPDNVPADVVVVARDAAPPTLAGPDTLELVLSGTTLVDRSGP